jgi:hypothetical protein
MELLAPFVERRSHARLKETPLRRRNNLSHSIDTRLARSERRRTDERSIASARILELNLDRYPTKPAMLTCLQSLLYAAEGTDTRPWQLDYVTSLRKAVAALRDSPSPLEAAATLRGYRGVMNAHHTSRLGVAPYV